jgi:D-cysteine desulfhydrase
MRKGFAFAHNQATQLRLAGLEPLRLGQGPTPVRPLAGLGGSAAVWLKDDGGYAAHGGNKARKLEWLLADALRRGRRTVITGGAIGTNHGLATALYARELGLRAVLVLVPQPDSEHVRTQLARIRDSDAELHFAAGTARAFFLAATLHLRRTAPPWRPPYLILPGGSVPLGCVGYVQAGVELGQQVHEGLLPEPSHVVVALGSGGTAAGLLLGMRASGLRSRLVCVLVNDRMRVGARRVLRLARRTQRLLARRAAGLPQVRISAADLLVRDDWLGAGYGHPTAAAARATAAFAAQGVALDPVYTAKAAAGLLELNEHGELGPGPVLFWLTAGPRPDGTSSRR